MIESLPTNTRSLVSFWILFFSWIFFYWEILFSIIAGTGEVWVMLVSGGIFLATLYLIYRERTLFKNVLLTSSQLGLLCLFLLSVGFIAGGVGRVYYAEQSAVMLMLPALALTVCGPELARILFFPLLYILLIIPLQDLEFSYRYLVGWVAFGLFYSALKYASTEPRVLFTAASILIPFAVMEWFGKINWISASAIFVLLLVVGELITDRKPVSISTEGEAIRPPWLFENVRFFAPTLIAFFVLMVSPWLSENIRSFYPEMRQSIPLIAPVGVGNWTGPFQIKGEHFQPEFPLSSGVMQAEYRLNDALIAPMWLYSAYYDANKPIKNVIVDTQPLYNASHPFSMQLDKNQTLSVLESTVPMGEVTLLIWYWYHILGVDTLDLELAKLLDNVRLISKYADGSGIILIATPYTGSIEEARARSASFLQTMYPSLEILKRPERLLSKRSRKLTEGF